jgi:hypothetical protein
MFPSCSYYFSSSSSSPKTPPLHFPSPFFPLLLSIMFTIACIILLCVYFQGFSLRSIFSNTFIGVGYEEEKKKKEGKQEVELYNIYMNRFFFSGHSFLSSIR